MTMNAVLNEEFITEYMISFHAWGNRSVHRSTLESQLCLHRSTVYDALVRLEVKGIVKRINKREGKRGRPLVFWQLTGPEFS